jgi:flagellin-like hook-associated protein FlgL
LSPIAFDVIFAEPVSNFATGDVTVISSSGEPLIGVVSSVSGSLPDNAYTVAVDVTLSGVVTASIAAGVATDALGIANLASASIDNAVVFDKTGALIDDVAAIEAKLDDKTQCMCVCVDNVCCIVDRCCCCCCCVVTDDDELSAHHTAVIDKLDTAIDETNANEDKIDTAIDGINANNVKLTTAIDQINANEARINATIDEINANEGRIDDAINEIDNNEIKIDTAIDKINANEQLLLNETRCKFCVVLRYEYVD